MSGAPKPWNSLGLGAGRWEIHSLYYFSAFVCVQKYISLSLKCKWLGLSLSQTQVGLGYHRYSVKVYRKYTKIALLSLKLKVLNAPTSIHAFFHLTVISTVCPQNSLLCSVTQSYLTLCDPMNCSPLGFSVHGILQARILEQIAISFSRRSSWPRDSTHVTYVSALTGGFFTTVVPRLLKMIAPIYTSPF